MKVLLLDQAFYPDVVSVAQHASGLSRMLVARGHEVTVVASQRGYDDPSMRFHLRETWHGVQIVRVRCTGFGKGAKWRRAADFATFLGSCCIQLMMLGRFDLVVSMTAPPLLSVPAALFAWLWGGRLVVWVMDLNPDEAIAVGWLRNGSLTAKFLEALLRFSLRRAENIVVLDRFMRDRVAQKGIAPEKVAVIPPWSHDKAVRYDPAGRQTFRKQHGLEGKYVVMYSGNHSPCHPLETLLEAAARLGGQPEIAFCFVGGGSEFGKVRRFAEERSLRNIVCVPYQPLERLSASLSAADLHVVVMGDALVGIVHPCKIYNILALGIPFLYIGPEQSHVGEVLKLTREIQRTQRAFRHGEVDALAQSILDWARRGPHRSDEATLLAGRYSEAVLAGGFVDLLENVTVERDTKATVPVNQVSTER